MRGVREFRVRFLEFEVGNDNIAVAAVGMWKSRLFAISKGGGKRVKTCDWFSSLSTARHFHGRSCGPNALARTSTSALANLNRLSYPHQTAKNPDNTYWDRPGTLEKLQGARFCIPPDYAV